MIRKRHQYRLLLVAFVYSLIGIAFFASYAGMRSKQKAVDKQTYEQANATSADDSKPKWWEDPMALATIILAVATTGMAIAIWRQVKLARDEFNATHRPKIIVHMFEVAHDSNPEGAQTLGAQFNIVNEGLSDAYVTDVATKVFTTNQPTPGVKLDHRPVYRTLRPGEHWSYAVFSGALDDAVADVVAKMSHGAVADLWFIGKVVYFDGDGRQRKMGFCRRYDRKGNRWIKAPESDYEYSY